MGDCSCGTVKCILTQIPMARKRAPVAAAHILSALDSHAPPGEVSELRFTAEPHCEPGCARQAGVVLERGAAVCGVVVPDEDILDEFVPSPRTCLALPALNRVASMNSNETVKLRTQRFRISDEM